MKIEIPEENIIACICEGNAEATIMDILIDSHQLSFDREQLLDQEIIMRVGVKEFEKRYLRKEFNKKITVLRILDSPREQFNLSKAYREQVEVITIITSPEIEMLIIHNEGKYQEYARVKSTTKPSEYCKTQLHMKNVKKASFIEEYFKDPQLLVDAIKQYDRNHRRRTHEHTLLDLIIE